MIILYIFLIAGFLGWLAELTFKSLEAGRFVLTFHKIHRLPFLPIYGFGALYLIAIQPAFIHLPILQRGIIYALALSALEFVGGIFSELIYRKRLWDYSSKAFNIYGHVDLEHFIYWFTLGIIFDQIIYPVSLKMIK